ncbi:UDP-N-acetylmuramoyl-L-alanyl-D-glutamate--2,6-diaminopimelate ligase [Magnetovibrio sp.]|uniref:Mur ligase family protein n=1 Tax=Magnetovibrio sp. TaxID=2024836 RepID=UPI002F936553
MGVFHANDALIDDALPLDISPPGYGHPSEDLCVIGVTGTNGKTTVSYLLGEVLKAAGHNPFVLGTYNSGNRDLSTPEKLDTARFMTDHLDQGGTHFVMEVTSEGIDQGRILGIDFDVKILTNITQDHLDYHKTFAHYEKVKMDFMRQGLAHKIYPADFRDESIDFEPQLLGDFNYLNIQAAVSALRYIGIGESFTRKTLSACLAPRGRMEPVVQGQPFMVLVDYAHTPDGLENVLRTAKDIAVTRNGQLWVVFGCGGDRDRGKRPQMGKIAAEIADRVVITDDNPRDEDSQTILNEVFGGVGAQARNCVLIANRRSAIEHAINNASENDVVILAGKGHETLQISKGENVHFDDREEAVNAIVVRLKTQMNT